MEPVVVRVAPQNWIRMAQAERERRGGCKPWLEEAVTGPGRRGGFFRAPARRCACRLASSRRASIINAVPDLASDETFAARLQDASVSFVREGCPGSKAMLIAFGGIQLGLGMPPFEFFRLAREVPAHKLFFRDPHQAWYHRGLPGVARRMAGIAEFVRQEIAASGATRVAMFGNSMGGYAALLFGALAGGGEVHAFAPQTFLSPWLRLRCGDSRWRRHIRAAWLSADGFRHLDLRPVLRRAAQTQFHVYYSSENRLDARHARHLEGLANVSLHDLPEGGHQVVKLLRDNGTLPQIIRRALTEPVPL